MSDYLVRAVGAYKKVRVFAAVTTKLVEEARKRHGTSPVATAALGRTLTAGLLLGANLKGDDLVTLRILGNGPLGAILVSADARGTVRGYVQEPTADLPSSDKYKLPVGRAVGQGYLHVSRDLGMKLPFTGSVPLVSGEIAEDLAHYLNASEQTPSAVALGVLVDRNTSVLASGGWLVQMMPGADENAVAVVEKNVKEIQAPSVLVHEGVTPEMMAGLLLKGLDYEVLDAAPVSFKCKCSRDRVKAVLLSFGADDLQNMLEEDGKAEVKCHFCGKSYSFGADDLKELIGQLQDGETGT